MATWEWRGAPVWWLRTRSVLALLVIGVGVGLSRPHPALTGPGRWTMVGLVGVAAGWAMWISGRYVWPGLVLSGVAGVLVSLTNPTGPALAYPAIVCLQAGARFEPRRTIGFTAGLVLLYAAGLATVHGGSLRLLVGVLALAAGLGTGLFRRQNALLHEEATRARAEEGVLAERARMAREIHDVLAHALAALSLQLELADALLERGRTDDARLSVVRAGRLAREGLAETRQAIGALRGEALPLPDLVDALVTGYRADLDAPASLTVDGPPRDLDPDVALALYRTAQEALTNVRKHAPGAPVSVSLSYRADAVSVTVHNGQSVRPPVPDAVGGYGLAGLGERAALVGGTLEAGPDGGGWRTGVRIPT